MKKTAKIVSSFVSSASGSSVRIVQSQDNETSAPRLIVEISRGKDALGEPVWEPEVSSDHKGNMIVASLASRISVLEDTVETLKRSNTDILSELEIVKRSLGALTSRS